MEMLQVLEKEAQQLLKAEIDEGQEVGAVPVENQLVLEQVQSLKGEIVTLNDTVAAQKAQTTEAVVALEKCRSELGQIKPWLEAAEVKVSKSPFKRSVGISNV